MQSLEMLWKKHASSEKLDITVPTMKRHLDNSNRLETAWITPRDELRSVSISWRTTMFFSGIFLEMCSYATFVLEDR